MCLTARLERQGRPQIHGLQGIHRSTYALVRNHERSGRSMGLLSDFFIADASPVPKYDGGGAFVDADKCQFKGLSPLQCGQFLAVLRGQEYTIDMVSEFKLVTPEE